MSCEVCKRFPVPTSKFEEVAISMERHGTLYKCTACGTYLELIAEERSARNTPMEELKKYYPSAFEGRS